MAHKKDGKGWLLYLLNTKTTVAVYEGQYFVDVEGTKNVKQMISLLAITGQFMLRNNNTQNNIQNKVISE